LDAGRFALPGPVTTTVAVMPAFWCVVAAGDGLQRWITPGAGPRFLAIGANPTVSL